MYNWQQAQYNDLELDIIYSLHEIITQTIQLGFDKWSKDQEKVNYLHENLKRLMINYINLDKYDIIIEWKVAWMLDTKDCDIVIVNKKYFKTNNGKTLDEVQKQWKWWGTIIIDWVEEVISVKNPISSYKKNAANYRESMIWEAVNIKWAGIRYTHFMFLSDYIPVYDKKWNLKTIEAITKKEIKILKTLKSVKINNLNLIDDFVTFLYNIKKYDEIFSNKEELIGEIPWITIYTEDIVDIEYTFYFFEYLEEFFERYEK